MLWFYLTFHYGLFAIFHFIMAIHYCHRLLPRDTLRLCAIYAYMPHLLLRRAAVRAICWYMSPRYNRHYYHLLIRLSPYWYFWLPLSPMFIRVMPLERLMLINGAIVIWFSLRQLYYMFTGHCHMLRFRRYHIYAASLRSLLFHATPRVCAWWCQEHWAIRLTYVTLLFTYLSYQPLFSYADVISLRRWLYFIYYYHYVDDIIRHCHGSLSFTPLIYFSSLAQRAVSFAIGHTGEPLLTPFTLVIRRFSFYLRHAD